jgi:uncharacterized protein (TIGR02147 family)
MTNVFTYHDYREFLRDKFMEIKAQRKTFSHRAFAKMAGFNSSNYLMLVMQGKRNLSPEGIIKVSKAIKLKKKEADFFENLVMFCQAKNDDEKNFYYSRISSNRQYAQARPLEMEQYDYYSHWCVPVIREMVLLKEFKEDPAWIAKHTVPNVTTQEAEAALKLLLDMNLLVRDEGGKLVQQDRHIRGEDEVSSLAMANFQREMISLAGKSIERTAPEKREISSVTFTISKDRLVQAKEMVREFRSKLAGFLAGEEEGETVYQFNMQLFNLTKKREGE